MNPPSQFASGPIVAHFCEKSEMGNNFHFPSQSGADSDGDAGSERACVFLAAYTKSNDDF
jgi:hypothetical protein